MALVRSTDSYPLFLNWPNIVFAALSGNESSLTDGERKILASLRAELQSKTSKED